MDLGMLRLSASLGQCSPRWTLISVHMRSLAYHRFRNLGPYWRLDWLDIRYNCDKWSYVYIYIEICVYIYIYIHKSQTWYPNNAPTMSQYNPRNWDQHSTLLRVKHIAMLITVGWNPEIAPVSWGSMLEAVKVINRPDCKPSHNSSSKLKGIWICHIWAWIKIYGKNYKIP